MSILPIILIVFLIIVLLYVIATYNSLKTLQVRIKASLQEIGNQLKRQANLIPNLENTVKGSTKHEKDIFNSLKEARQMGNKVEATDLKQVEKLAANLQSLGAKTQVLVESNPQLQANSNFTKMMSELGDTADKLMYARRLLIDLTAKYNIKLEVFPSNLVAQLFKFEPQAGLQTPETGAHVEVSDAETKDVKVGF